MAGLPRDLDLLSSTNGTVWIPRVTTAHPGNSSSVDGCLRNASAERAVSRLDTSTRPGLHSDRRFHADKYRPGAIVPASQIMLA